MYYLGAFPYLIPREMPVVQERKTRQKAKTEETHAEVSNTDVTNAELAEVTEQVVADIDDVLEDLFDEDLLADIDDVLERDAQGFVDGFVQQGGE